MTRDEETALDVCMSLRRRWMRQESADQVDFAAANDALVDCGQVVLASALASLRVCVGCMVPEALHAERSVEGMFEVSLDPLGVYGFNLSRIMPSCVRCGRHGRPRGSDRCPICHNRGYTFLWLADEWACRACFGTGRTPSLGTRCLGCGGHDGMVRGSPRPVATWRHWAFGVQACPVYTRYQTIADPRVRGVHR